MKKIQLGGYKPKGSPIQGWVLVDDEDYEWLNQWKWHMETSRRTFYAVRAEYKNGKLRQVKMHRLIMGLTHGDGKIVDHIDGDGLNNQRVNLRIVTVKENSQNRHRTWGKSKYMGVSYVKPWTAKITVNGKYLHLGYFESEVEAALAYNEAAKKYRGEKARLNYI